MTTKYSVIVEDAGFADGAAHLPVSDDHPLPVTSVGGGGSSGPVTGTTTDRSGTIAAGGTAQQLAPANSSRKYLRIQNNSSADLWYNLTTTAVQSQPSIRLFAGQSDVWEGSSITTEAVSIIGATTGQTFTAKEM